MEVPSALVERQIYYMMMETQQKMLSAGDENTAMDFNLKMKDKYKPDAEKIVKSFLVLKKIAEKESITATDGDLESYLRELAQHSGRDYESFQKMYNIEERKRFPDDGIGSKRYLTLLNRMQILRPWKKSD